MIRLQQVLFSDRILHLSSKMELYEIESHYLVIIYISIITAGLDIFHFHYTCYVQIYIIYCDFSISEKCTNI